MNSFIPHYINEHQSDVRRVKDGWYAVDGAGNLCSGPFCSRDECLKCIHQPPDALIPGGDGQRPH